MLVKTFGSAVYGVNATTITIETNVSEGIKFYLVGLPGQKSSNKHGPCRYQKRRIGL